MKTEKENMTLVPRMTMEVINSMLLSEEGINISPIVKDLQGMGGNDYDSPLNSELLTTMNVALLLKGKAPQLSKEEMLPRYQYGQAERKYEFISYSLLHNKVVAKRADYRSPETFSLQQWLEWPTEPKEEKPAN